MIAMLSADRHERILHRLAEAGSVRVADLAQHLDVAEETIRRDLNQLAQAGRVQRTHGGATLVNLDSASARMELSYAQRRQSHQREKRALAMSAMELLDEGDTLALDASSTACELAGLLPDKKLTVVTPSLVVCNALRSRADITTVCTGGVLDASSMSFVGPVAEQTIRRFNIQWFFFSCRGVDWDRGLSEATSEHAQIKSTMVQCSQRSALLADASKLGLKSSVFFMPTQDLDILITEANPADAPANFPRWDRLEAAGVDVRLVEMP